MMGLAVAVVAVGAASLVVSVAAFVFDHRRPAYRGRHRAMW